MEDYLMWSGIFFIVISILFLWMLNKEDKSSEELKRRQEGDKKDRVLNLDNKNGRDFCNKEKDDDDFITSTIAGYATNSTLMGAAIGGSVTGAMIGDMLNEDENENNFNDDSWDDD